MKEKVMRAALASVLALVCVPLAVSAGEPSTASVTVHATGQASARPDTMYVRLMAEAGADTAVEARKKCAKNAEEVAKAVGALNLPNAAVASKACRFIGSAGAGMVGMPADGIDVGEAPVGASRAVQVVEIKIAGIQDKKREELAEMLAKIVDAAGKLEVRLAAGASSAFEARMMGGESGPAAVEYAVADISALRDKALKEAMAQAKVTLASLEGLGVKVGKLRGVVCSGREDYEYVSPWSASRSGRSRIVGKSAFSTDPEEVVVSASLTVTHDIAE
jgi:uncharacterized protein YggE